MKIKRLSPQRHVKRDPTTGVFVLPKSAGKHDTITFDCLNFRPLVLDVEQVAVALARTGMPGLIRASAKSGRAFLIQNAKNPSAASALLINPDVLKKRLAQLRPTRTLGQLLDSLPFQRRGSPRLTVELPDDDAPELRVQGRAEGPSAKVVAPRNLRTRSAGKVA